MMIMMMEQPGMLKHILYVKLMNGSLKPPTMLLVNVTNVRCLYLAVKFAQTQTLVSNVDHLKKEISSLGKSYYLIVLKNAHLVLTPTKTMNVCLVKVVLNVLVQCLLTVLAVTISGDKMLLIMLLLITGKVSSNLLPIKLKLLVVKLFLSKKEVLLSKVLALKNVVMVTIQPETKKNAYLVMLCVKLASMILLIVLHQKLVKLNSWVNSMILVQKVCKPPQLLLVMILGTPVVVLKAVLLTLVSFKKISTKNSVSNVKIPLSGISKKLDNVMMLLKNVLLL